MRGILISIALVGVLVLGGFGFLVMSADNLAGEPEEVRIEVTDELRD